MNELLGKIHFWGSLVCMNLIFMPMFIQGLAGMSRRLSDGGYDYAHVKDVAYLNEIMSIAAFVLMFFQLFFIGNFFWTLFRKRYETESDANPWKATTIEWTETTSPPLGHGNFEKAPIVHRGPYEYSVPGNKTDFTPQTKS